VTCAACRCFVKRDGKCRGCAGLAGLRKASLPLLALLFAVCRSGEGCFRLVNRPHADEEATRGVLVMTAQSINIMFTSRNEHAMQYNRRVGIDVQQARALGDNVLEVDVVENWYGRNTGAKLRLELVEIVEGPVIKGHVLPPVWVGLNRSGGVERERSFPATHYFTGYARPDGDSRPPELDKLPERCHTDKEVDRAERLRAREEAKVRDERRRNLK